MKLEPEHEAMLAGARGWPLQLAMRQLVAVGRAERADQLIPVRSAHIVIDGVTLGEPGLALMERVAGEGGRFVVPTTINAIAMDRRLGAAERSEADRRQARTLAAVEAMGGVPTCSCNPFSQAVLPLFGESVAWSESGTAPFLNAILGARSNREGVSALASALTGLTPRYGMHLDAARRGQALVTVTAEIAGIEGWGLLGLHLARRWPGRIPVLRGLPRPSFDEAVALSAAFAIAGSAPMFHILGVTPEAPDLAAVFPAGPPPAAEQVTDEHLAAERRRLEAGDDGAVDLVVVGCPHASLAQLMEIERLVAGRPLRAALVAHTNHSVWGVAQASGLAARLAAAGARITVDRMCWGCDFADRAGDAGKTIATNSAKLAFVAPGSRRARIRYGSAAACIEAAVSGRWA
jgi:predicted aconitase